MKLKHLIGAAAALLGACALATTAFAENYYVTDGNQGAALTISVGDTVYYTPSNGGHYQYLDASTSGFEAERTAFYTSNLKNSSNEFIMRMDISQVEPPYTWTALAPGYIEEHFTGGEYQNLQYLCITIEANDSDTPTATPAPTTPSTPTNSTYVHNVGQYTTAPAPNASKIFADDYGSAVEDMGAVFTCTCDDPDAFEKLSLIERRGEVCAYGLAKKVGTFTLTISHKGIVCDTMNVRIENNEEPYVTSYHTTRLSQCMYAPAPTASKILMDIYGGVMEDANAVFTCTCDDPDAFESLTPVNLNNSKNEPYIYIMGMPKKAGTFTLTVTRNGLACDTITAVIVDRSDENTTSSDDDNDNSTGTPAAPVDTRSEADIAREEAIANGTWGIQYTTCTSCGYHNWTRVGNVYVCDSCGHTVTTVKGPANVKGYVAGTGTEVSAPATQYATAAEAQAAADKREAAYAASVKALQAAIARQEAAYKAALAAAQ